MNRRDFTRQQGFEAFVLPLAITGILLVVAIIFGGWTFAQMLDYKNNSDTKVQAAVAAAKQAEDQVKDAAFAEAEKQPLRTYTGPAQYGTVTISYPKTWSGYVADGRRSSPYIDGYFYPGTVPDLQSQGSVFALRVQVVDSAYNSELNNVSSYVKDGKAKVTPFKAPKVPGVIGARIDGKLDATRSGSMILIPLRSQTLKIWTEAPQFQADFNNNILPNLTFLP